MTLSTSRGRGLLLQRLGEIVGALAQLVEQPRVLDGDDGLRGEVLDQLDLLFGERPNLLPIDGDEADDLVVFEHRHEHKGTGASQIEKLPETRIGRLVGNESGHILDMDRPLFVNDPAERRIGTGLQDRMPPTEFRECLGRVVHRDVVEGVILPEHEVGELRTAKARGIGKQRLEHRLDRARRCADDLQHLARSRSAAPATR